MIFLVKSCDYGTVGGGPSIISNIDSRRDKGRSRRTEGEGERPRRKEWCGLTEAVRLWRWDRIEEKGLYGKGR